MTSAPMLGFAAAGCACLAVAEIAAATWPAVLSRAPAAALRIASMAEAPLRIGRDGRDPGVRERRRLLLGGAICAFVLGWALLGLVPALALAAGGPWAVSRVLAGARERYRGSVEAGAAAIALALADAMGGGHSIRGAISEAAAGLDGAAGHELRRVARELMLGAPTDIALESMRARVRSHGIDTIVAACLLQRRSGGDLARLLRDCSRAFADQRRLERDVRAATAQARFTGLIVVMLPLGGALLAELASPGYLKSLAGSFLTAWLAGLALVMQLIAAVLIRRLGRVRV